MAAGGCRWRPFFAYKILVNGYDPYSDICATLVLHTKCHSMSAEVIAIPRAALHEQVAQRLRQMLVEGRIAPAPSSTSASCPSA
jgi:hypothetical protein